MTTAIEQTLETYGIENWSAGYFDVNRKGNLIVRPVEGDPRSADLKEIIDDLAKRGITTPVLLRFPQLVAAQVRKLQRAFSRSIREFEYQGSHMCVYPMKVNQQRAVVEEYLREGSRYDFGLEAGSKAELYAALALEQPGDSLLVLNGFKDQEFIELAFAGAKVGKKVVIVIEKLNELDHVLNVVERHDGALPMLGMRVKLYSKGSGRWEKSGGEAAKFGLTTTELLEVINRLKEADRIDMLKLLHFHIGSQLTDIKRIKNAMKEAARTYAKIRQMNIPVEYLDVGGGLGVAYQAGDDVMSLDLYARTILSAVAGSGLTLRLEPGRPVALRGVERVERRPFLLGQARRRRPAAREHGAHLGRYRRRQVDMDAKQPGRRLEGGGARGQDGQHPRRHPAASPPCATL